VSRPERERGVATVEFALLLGVMLLLIALVWPIGNAFAQKLALDHAMSDTIRYATATPNLPGTDAEPGAAAGSDGRRPDCLQVQEEFTKANGGIAPSDFTMTAQDPNGVSLGTVCSGAVGNGASTLDPGDTVTINVDKSNALGPIGTLLSIAGIHSSTVTVTAAASGREE
jgi:Flp pilus assembly protein TadG